MAYYDRQAVTERTGFAETSHRSSNRQYEEGYTGQSRTNGSDFSSASYSRLEHISGSSQGYGERAFQCFSSFESETGRESRFRSSHSSGVIRSDLHCDMQSSSSSFYPETQSMDFERSTEDFGDKRDLAPKLQQNQSLSVATAGENIFTGQWPANESGIVESARNVISDYDHKYVQSSSSGLNHDRDSREFTEFDSKQTMKRDRQHSRSPRRDSRFGSNPSGHDNSGDMLVRDNRYSSKATDGSYERRSKVSKFDNAGTSKDRSHRRHYSPDSRERGKKSSTSRARDDSGYGENQDSVERHSRRRSRSRDRERRHRDSDRDKRHRHSDRDRYRGGRHLSRDQDKDRGRSPREVPWVPPPLPEHLRQVPAVPGLPPPLPPNQQQGSSSVPWVPPPVAASAQPAAPQLQNHFQNDGSFLAMFRKKMQSASTVQQQSEDSNHSDAHSTSCSETSGAGTAIIRATLAPALPSSGMPVIARRRISKILKTGVVQKPKKDSAPAAVPAGVGSDAWSSYMNEVQKYRANKCIEDESCRPLMK